MKYAKSYICALLLATVVLSLVSCDFTKVEDRSFKGSKVGFETQASTYNLGPSQSGTVALTVQLISKQRNTDLTFEVTAVDSSTTATEGSDFSLPSSSVTIPADSSSAAYNVQVSGANLSLGKGKTITLRVNGTNDIKSATILGQHTITLVGAEGEPAESNDVIQ